MRQDRVSFDLILGEGVRSTARGAQFLMTQAGSFRIRRLRESRSRATRIGVLTTADRSERSRKPSFQSHARQKNGLRRSKPRFAPCFSIRLTLTSRRP